MRPFSEAPKDGRWILAKTASKTADKTASKTADKTASKTADEAAGRTADGFMVCHWDRDPPGLAGPTWTEANDASRGYLDDYFEGWIDPAGLKLWDYATLADLLIAFVDDANARGDERTLRILRSRAKQG